MQYIEWSIVCCIVNRRVQRTRGVQRVRIGIDIKLTTDLAARRGYDLTHRSRPVCTDDFYDFDLIIGMDGRNIDDLKDRAPSVEAWKKIHRMTEYCTKFTHADHVPDPYYGGAEGFEYVLDVLEDACAGLLEMVGSNG